MELVEGGTGGVHRILTRLTEAGLLTVTRVANQKYYQANDGHLIFPELCSIIGKTVGLVDPLEQALRPYAKKMIAAFVYGPVGKKLESQGSEIEVVVVSDSVDYPELVLALNSAEKVLGRTVTPIVFSTQEWRTNHATPLTTVWRIAKEPRLFLAGSEDALQTIARLRWR